VDLTPELCARVARAVPDPGPEPTLPYYTDEEYDAAVQEALRGFPGGQDPWLFGYGSLIWRPGCDVEESRVGVIRGWHRSFCLKTTRWRGTPEQPGLIMALERGGQCRGVAFRLDPARAAENLLKVFRREIGVKPVNHIPRFVKVASAAGDVTALTFVANPGGRSYLGKLSPEETAGILARAVGHWGSCAEYLYQTVRNLESLGIRDRGLWKLQELVAAEIRALTGEPPPRDV
jgi:cation transport protein ChaC